MPDYIEREAAIKIASGYCHHANIAAELKKLPAADVRPVVLCQDCKWCHAGYCEKYDDLIPWGVATGRPWEDWFCADGRKADV